MKWVKCVNKTGYGFTYDKIYQVKNYFDWNGLKYIELLDDDDRPITIDMFASHPNAKMWFEDATVDIRNNKINSILND